MNNTPWELMRFFLAVVEEGSLSAAAKTLNVSQPTLSRGIQALEKKTQLNLFKRSTQGLSLTNAGSKLVESAHKMNAAAESFDRKVSGLSTELKGDIRISANEMVGIYLLPSVIAAFHLQHPAVNIEIVITNQETSLNKREADLALRMFRPTQSDLIAKRLPDMELGFFASQSYIEKHGTPTDFKDFTQHKIIGFDEGKDFIEGADAMGFEFTKKDFQIRTDNLMMQINLAKVGCGIVGTHRKIAEQEKGLIQILNWIPLPPLQFWIVYHADTQHNARIREFKNFLITWFKDDPYKGLV